jgi:hypothetical protein
MKLALLALQVVILSVAFLSDALSVTGYLALYFADFVAVSLYFSYVSGDVNWVLDRGYILLAVYTIYYPLTAFFIVWNDFDTVLPDLVASHAQLSVLFISSFTCAYLVTVGDQLGKQREGRSAIAMRAYSNWVLVPLILLPYVLKLGIIWSTTGSSFTYGDVYTASFDLEASGLNVVNQILNVLSSVSVVALILFFSSEVRQGRWLSVGTLLGMLLLDSVYIGARTIFLAAALTLIVVYGGYHRIRAGIRTFTLLAAVLVFYFGVETARTTATAEAQDTGFILAEPFIIFSNASVFIGDVGNRAARPELNSYANDAIKIVPNYLYSTRLDISRWYMQEFYPGAYEKGVGLAFGFNTEALMNGGATAAVFQALAVGFLFAVVGRLQSKSRFRNTFLQVILVELVVGAYAVVRVTSFSFLAIFGSTFVALLVIEALNALAVADGERVPAVGAPTRS